MERPERAVSLLCAHIHGPWADPREIGFSFLVGYNAFMDAAGKPEHGPEEWCVVAGFISTVERWADFELCWNMLLQKHEIPYLQMSALHARKKPYTDSKWEDADYMASFLAEAGEMVRGHVLTWGADVVKNEDFAKACISRPGLPKFINAYGLCGTAVALRLQMGWILYHFRQMERASVEHFFEEGDSGVDGIGRAFRRAGMSQPIVRPGKPRKDAPGIRYYVQFQAADWLAFETRKMAKKYWPNKPQIRKSLQALLRNVKGEAKVWKYDDLIKFCDLKIAKGEME